MVSDARLLCLLNPQFRRLEDFSLWQRGAAGRAFFERGYVTSFAFEELACRGEGQASHMAHSHTVHSFPSVRC